MTTLREALNLTPRPLLLFMGRQRHLSYSSNLPKTELVHRLAQALADPANLQAALALLSKSEQQVLILIWSSPVATESQCFRNSGSRYCIERTKLVVNTVA